MNDTNLEIGEARPDRAKAGGPARRGLGRGLSALIPDGLGARVSSSSDGGRRAAAADGGRDALRYIDMRSITLNPRQPRKEFGREEMDELTGSIRAHGVLQPIVVRPTERGSFELIAGERRFRAACAAGLAQIPAVVREGLDERSSLALALIENIQREDLGPIETGRAYQQLLSDYHMTQADLAHAVGKSQPQIANTLRLLALPAEIQESLSAGAISEGHAKVILSVGSPEQMLELWSWIVSEGLNVRESERAAARVRAGKTLAGRREPAAVREPDAYLSEIAERLSLRVGSQVRLVPGKGERGVIEIAYYDQEHLEGLIERLA